MERINHQIALNVPIWEFIEAHKNKQLTKKYEGTDLELLLGRPLPVAEEHAEAAVNCLKEVRESMTSATTFANLLKKPFNSQQKLYLGTLQWEYENLMVSYWREEAERTPPTKNAAKVD
jgi:hypothetical protein